MVAGEQLERDQRRTAAGRALVLEPAAQELGLLAEAELADRAVGDGSLAVVAGPRSTLELVLPARPQAGELPLFPLLGECCRLGSG